MKILLDECLPRPLAALLTGHEVKTVRQMRWNGKENGELLALIGKHFDGFITVDKSLRHQQNLRDLKFAILVLRVKSNKLEGIVPHLPEVLSALRSIKAGDVRRISL
jgi:predicted nuclease of predicted toxin-antitoxin system